MGFSKQEYWSGVPLPSPLVYLTYIKLTLLNNLEKYLIKQLHIKRDNKGLSFHKKKIKNCSLTTNNYLIQIQIEWSYFTLL